MAFLIGITLGRKQIPLCGMKIFFFYRVNSADQGIIQ